MNNKFITENKPKGRKKYTALFKNDEFNYMSSTLSTIWFTEVRDDRNNLLKDFLELDIDKNQVMNVTFLNSLMLVYGEKITFTAQILLNPKEKEGFEFVNIEFKEK